MVCLARLRPFNVIQSQRLPPKRSKTKWYHYIQDLSVMYFNTVLFKFRPNISHSWSLDCSSFGSLILLNQLHLHMVSGRRKRMLSVEFFLTNQPFFCPAPVNTDGLGCLRHRLGILNCPRVSTACNDITSGVSRNLPILLWVEYISVEVGIEKWIVFMFKKSKSVQWLETLRWRRKQW